MKKTNADKNIKAVVTCNSTWALTRVGVGQLLGVILAFLEKLG